MVQHSGNGLAPRFRASSIHLPQGYHFSLRHSTTDEPDQLEEIVSQIVDELSDVAQRNPISRVVLYGARRRRVQGLMAKHPHMPSAITVQTQSRPEPTGQSSDARHQSTEAPFTVYRIDTDCYPFSSRFR